MSEQEKIKWLGRYSESEREIDRIQEEIAYWDSRATRVTVSFSGMPRGGKGEDPLQAAVEQLDGLRQKMGEKFAEFVALRTLITETVARVEDITLRELLRFRYFDRMTWEQVSERLGFAERQVYRLHKKALAALEEIV